MSLSSRISHLVIAVSCFVLISGFSYDARGLAQSQIHFDTHVSSRLWIEGSSSVHRFDCVARSIQGTAYMEAEEEQNPSDPSLPDLPDNRDHDGSAPAGPAAESGVVINPSHTGSATRNDAAPNAARLHVNLKIPIESFDCGHSRMNRDMYEALRSDTYDYITFEFEQAEPIEKGSAMPDSLFDGGYSPFMINGVLNVAGVDRQVSLVTQGRKEEEGRYRVRGHKEISMPDFDIEPPTALRGLIRAREDLTVFFDLLVLQEPESTASH
ncbi:YceI family protein [Balneolales bacterium ANBcel1]|nr:YceI family protein [Balneolales bacterium ANBcel1]